MFIRAFRNGTERDGVALADEVFGCAKLPGYVRQLAENEGEVCEIFNASKIMF